MDPQTDPDTSADGAPDDELRWKRLCVLSSELEARLIQGRLESEGLVCATESLVFHAEPVSFGALGRVRLYVLEEDLERAREILESVPDLPALEDDEDAAADGPDQAPPS